MLRKGSTPLPPSISTSPQAQRCLACGGCPVSSARQRRRKELATRDRFAQAVCAELRRQQVHRACRLIALVETLDLIAVGTPRNPVSKSVGTADHKLATPVAGDDFAFLHQILDVRRRAHLDESANSRPPIIDSFVHCDLLTPRRPHSGKPPERAPRHWRPGRPDQKAQWPA